MTTRSETKTAMMTDAEKLKAAKILGKMGIKDITKTINTLEEKYGPYAYDIVVKSAMAPYDIAKKSGKPITKSVQAVSYFENNNVDAGTLENILGKRVDRSKLNRKTSTGNTSSRSKQAKVDNRVDNRSKKTASTAKTSKSQGTSKPQKTATKTSKPQKTATKTSRTSAPSFQAPNTPPSYLNLGGVPKEWTNGMVNIPSYMNPNKPKTAEDVYNSMVYLDRGSVDMERLMKNAGVTEKDLQAVLTRNPENLSKLKAGSTGTKLAQRADKVTGSPQGLCLAGVQRIINGANVGIYMDARDKEWPAKEPLAGGSNSACNTYKYLGKKGFYSISVPNQPSSMTYIENAPKGTILSFDNRRADISHGRIKSPNPGNIHGHTVVCTSKKGVYACDGKQTKFNFNGRYGENIHLTFAPDTEVPRELALELIKEAQRRKERELAAQQKKNNGR